MGTVSDVRRLVLTAAVEAENQGAPESIVGALERAVIELWAEPRPGADPKAGFDHACQALQRWEDWTAVDTIARRRRAGWTAG